jgi:hypothetical protein
VLVTSTVHRQVAGLFIVEEKGAHDLKGIRAPMHLYRILRVSGGRRRKGARLLAPLIGREENLSAIVRRWEHARAGEGQFVLIAGEPGIGKSRLIEELRPRLAEIPHSWIEWSSSQLLQNTLCTQSRNGDALGSAVPKLSPSGDSRNSNPCSRRSGSTPQSIRRCSRR